MLREAKTRGFVPECICFDSWYASLKNLKAVRSYGWKWLTRLAPNRLVSKDYSGNRPPNVNEVPIESTGTIKGANSDCDRDPLFILRAMD